MKRSHTPRSLAAVVLTAGTVLLLALSGCSFSSSDTLKLGSPPIEDPATQQFVNEAAAAIGEAVGRKVEVTQTSDYLGIVEAMRSKLIDIAIFSPMPTVIAQDVAHVQPLVAGVGGNYTAAVVCSTQSGVRSLADVQTHSIAFVDAGSTTGNYVPRLLLKQAGVDVENLEETFVGSHDAAVLAVQQGSTDCAGIGTPVLASMTKSGVLHEGAVEIIAESKPIPISGVYIAREGLSDTITGQITKALVDEQPQDALKAIGAGTLVAAKDADWSLFRDAATELGIKLEDVK